MGSWGGEFVAPRSPRRVRGVPGRLPDADGRVTTVVVTPPGVRRFLTLGHEYVATNALDFIDFKLPSLT
jgi:hypothetical protein